MVSAPTNTTWLLRIISKIHYFFCFNSCQKGGAEITRFSSSGPFVCGHIRRQIFKVSCSNIFVTIRFLTASSRLHIVSLRVRKKFSGIKWKRGRPDWNISYSCTCTSLEGRDRESHPFTRKREHLKETDPDLMDLGGALLSCFLFHFFFRPNLFSYNGII